MTVYIVKRWPSLELGRSDSDFSFVHYSWCIFVYVCVCVFVLVFTSVQQRSGTDTRVAVQTAWLAVSVSSYHSRPRTFRGRFWCSRSLLMAEV